MAGCAKSPAVAPPAGAPALAAPTSSAAPVPAASEQPSEPPTARLSGPLRQPGDFVVTRFSGSFTTRPIEVKETLLERSGETIRYELAWSRGEEQQHLRLERSASSGALLRVQKLGVGEPEELSQQAYESLLASTLFIPDSNDAAGATEKGSCLVGERLLKCDKVSYAVTVGEKAAKFVVNRSELIPGGELGGEVTSAQGELLYRSEILDYGHVDASGSATAAR